MTLETAPLRPPGALAVYWDGRLVPAERLEHEIRVKVAAGDGGRPGWLVLVAEPVARRDLGRGERRRLGVPVFGVRIDDPAP